MKVISFIISNFTLISNTIRLQSGYAFRFKSLKWFSLLRTLSFAELEIVTLLLVNPGRCLGEILAYEEWVSYVNYINTPRILKARPPFKDMFLLPDDMTYHNNVLNKVYQSLSDEHWKAITSLKLKGVIAEDKLKPRMPLRDDVKFLVEISDAYKSIWFKYTG